MTINASKTKFIVFRTHGKIVNCQLIYNRNEIRMPENPEQIHIIKRIHNEGETKNFKLYGVLFDEYLSFDDHMSYLCTKKSTSLFCINRVKNFFNQNTKNVILRHDTLTPSVLYEYILTP